jgi:putative oxidoreductase
MSQDLGKLFLRLTIGALMLFHGVYKLRHGISGIEGGVTDHGLPRFFAYGVYIGEVVAPIALILGVFTRYAGAIVAFNMVVAVYLAHSTQLGDLGKGGGWAIELDVLYFMGAVTIACLGAGRYAVTRGVGRFA